MPAKPRQFTCPGCRRTRVTQVRRNLCSACYERLRPRERRTLATCESCERTRLAYHRRGVCPACYERQRRRVLKCGVCKREVEAPASFVAMGTCPRCWSRARVVAQFTCPACGETKRTRPHRGVCRACYERTRIRVATCLVCGQTRKMQVDGAGVCHACRSLEAARRRGVPPARPAEPPETVEARLVAHLAPLRRPWVREFLATAYRSRSPKTRQMCLRALAGFDRYLSEQTRISGGQWSLVTLDEVHAYLTETGRFALQPAKAFFTWLRTRKKVERPIARALPKPPRLLRLRLLSTGQVAECYGKWTAEDAYPPEALVGFLALVHCLRAGEIRLLRLSDVVSSDQVRIGGRLIHLALPVTQALARYMEWRYGNYAGPSTYLLVSRASRLHDRPISQSWFYSNLFKGVSVAQLRQTAIRHLIEGSGCDGLQLASYAGLSLAAVGVYMSAFSAPAPWPLSSRR